MSNLLARYPAGRLCTQETGENMSNLLARYPTGRLRTQETGENKRRARTIELNYIGKALARISTVASL